MFYFLSSSVTETDKRVTDTILLICFARCCIIFVGLLCAVLFCLLLCTTRLYVREGVLPGGPFDRRESSAKNLLIEDEIWMTFNEVEDFCNAKTLSLPLPDDQVAEDKLLAVLTEEKEGSCKFIYLGYKATPAVRYRSLDGSVAWPSLKVNSDVGVPAIDRDCVYLNFTYDEPRVSSTKVCGNEEQTCALYLTYIRGDILCEFNRFRCAHQQIGAWENIVQSFYSVAQKLRKNHSVLPLDMNYLPEDLQFGNLYRGMCVALAVEYVFKYEREGFVMPYVSERFTVVDPEYDCLAFDVPRQKLVTVSCEEYACPVCA